MKNADKATLCGFVKALCLEQIYIIDLLKMQVNCVKKKALQLKGHNAAKAASILLNPLGFDFPQPPGWAEGLLGDTVRPPLS